MLLQLQLPLPAPRRGFPTAEWWCCFRVHRCLWSEWQSLWRAPSWSPPDGSHSAGVRRGGVRVTLVALIAGPAVINGAGVYAQLIAVHVGERGAAVTGLERQDAAPAARIEVAAHNIADLDPRLGQIDTAIEEAAKRANTNTALSAIEGPAQGPCGPRQ
jgi:hypothetical protein